MPEFAPNINAFRYLCQAVNSTDADVNLQAHDGQYSIIQDKRSLVAPIPQQPGYSEAAAIEAVRAIEAIARWRNILNLSSLWKTVRSRYSSSSEFIQTVRQSIRMRSVKCLLFSSSSVGN